MIQTRKSTTTSLDSMQSGPSKAHSPAALENKACNDAHLFDDKWQPFVELPPATRQDVWRGEISSPYNEPYSADAFAAMTFCYTGFEDDMVISHSAEQSTR